MNDGDDDVDYGFDSPSPAKRAPAPHPATRPAPAGPSAPATATVRDAGDDGGDDDELYGDLYAEGGGEAVGVLTLQTAELRRRADAQAARIEALETALAAAAAARDEAVRERDTLLVNISRLYATAREELARRDGAIREARRGGGGGG